MGDVQGGKSWEKPTLLGCPEWTSTEGPRCHQPNGSQNWVELCPEMETSANRTWAEAKGPVGVDQVASGKVSQKNGVCEAYSGQMGDRP